MEIEKLRNLGFTVNLVDGCWIEIQHDRFGSRRYYVTVGKLLKMAKANTYYGALEVLALAG